MTSKTLIPSNLAFSASVAASYFAMFGETESGERRPIQVTERKVRGTINIYHADPVAALELDKNNPCTPIGQWIDVAHLGLDEVALIVKGSLMFHSNSLDAHNITDPVFESKLDRFVELMRERGGYAEIARRFTLNIARGMFLWDNAKLGPSFVTLTVKGLGSHTFACNPLRKNSNAFSFDVFSAEDRPFAESLATAIEKALSENNPYALRVDVEARVEAPPGINVKPSQLWVRKDESKAADDAKGKHLAFLTPAGTQLKQAVLGPEKVTAMVKRIDTWYGVEVANSLSVYGTDLMRATAHRTGTSLAQPNPSFYYCLTNIDTLIEQLEQDATPNGHALYTLGMLIQAGVFGTAAETQGAEKASKGKGKKKGKAAASTDDDDDEASAA